VKRLVVVLLICAFPARAWVRTKTNGTGLCVWWLPHGHSFQIDSQGTPDAPTADTFTAVRNSFATWAAVSCSDLAFPEQPLSTSPQDRRVGYFQDPTITNHNLVLWRTRACRDVVPANDACLTQGGCSNAYDCWDDSHGDSVIATTTTTADRSTGKILDTDIELNDAPSTTGTKFTFSVVDVLSCPTQSGMGCIDIQNTVTHEAGHTLGLDHSPDPNATMYANAPPGETSKRHLGTDDIAGICAIYPKGQPTVTCVAQESSSGCGCSQAQTGPGAALGALALLLQIRRRSRRRPQLAIRASTKAATAIRFQSGSEN
jgi:MYXO-CTERM domain-containing protein